MDRILHGRKNELGKQKISSKYHQSAEKRNSLHVSISCVVIPVLGNVTYHTLLLIWLFHILQTVRLIPVRVYLASKKFCIV